MKILIQKFGGTSVSTLQRRKHVVEKVLMAIEKGFSPILVVSAIGRKGEPYATDTLLSLLSSEFKKENLLAMDLLMSCGETISATVLCDELNTNGLDCIPITGGQAGIITNDNYTNADVLSVNPERILALVESGKIPVVTGFQGISKQGYITTLGRGGSDVTAALLGAAVNAKEVEIYTDVDGIMTADPKIVSNASLIEEISYNELFQFADQGAKVIHPRAIEIAMKANIPILIKNTMSNCSGTMINNVGIVDCNNIITGITHMSNRVQITINLSDNSDNNCYYDLLNILAENCISIDLINVFPSKSIFTIDTIDIDKFDVLLKNMKLNYTSIDNCSKVAIIGSRMRGIPGVMARILKALNSENIEILQTADSHTTIWCLIRSELTEKAINALHKEFNLG